MVMAWLWGWGPTGSGGTSFVPLLLIMATSSIAPPAVHGCGVQCLALPPGCATAPVQYTKAGESDEWTFGQLSGSDGEWTLDVHDMMLTDDLEDPRSGKGTCPDAYESVGVVCACAVTRAELEQHDADQEGGQDLLVQLEADAGFSFDAGGLCYTTDRAAATSGWTEDPDCPAGGIGYVKSCPPSELQREGACGMGLELKALFVAIVGVVLLVFARVLCRKSPAGPTAVAEQAAPRHTRPAVMAAVP